MDEIFYQIINPEIYVIEEEDKKKLTLDRSAFHICNTVFANVRIWTEMPSVFANTFCKLHTFYK